MRYLLSETPPSFFNSNNYTYNNKKKYIEFSTTQRVVVGTSSKLKCGQLVYLQPHCHLRNPCSRCSFVGTDCRLYTNTTSFSARNCRAWHSTIYLKTRNERQSCTKRNARTSGETREPKIPAG